LRDAPAKSALRERERFIVRTSKPGLDRYSAGVPLAVLLIILLDVFNVFPVTYSPKWPLLIVFIIIVGFVRTQDPRSMLRRGFSRLKPKLSTEKLPLQQFGISAVGLALCIYLYVLPAQRSALRDYKNIDVIFVALGGMIGTIIALAFSLSIIPIQRAVETFTPSVARLYRKDKTSQRVFFFLGLFCLTSFVCSVDRAFFGIENWVLLPIGIVMAAVSLDLLRLHYRRVAQLLEPAEAIQRLLREVTGFIDQTQETIAREAALRWQLLSEDQKASASPRHIEAAFYGQSTAFVQYINIRSGELAEIATKAIARGEPFTAERSIQALTEIVRHYSTARRENLVIRAVPETLFSVCDSDLRSVVDPVYEILQDINRSAIALKAENVCIYVTRALAGVAIHNLALHSKEPTNRAAVLAWKPLGYLKGCVQEAQRAGLSNAAFQ